MSTAAAQQNRSVWGAGRGPGWVPGGRPRGDTPLTCLVVIIVSLIGMVWGYYHFFHNRALENAGKDIIISTATDDETRNNYLRRMRINLIPAVLHMGRKTRVLSAQVFNGKIKDPAVAEESILPIENRLRELIGEINNQNAPKNHADMHRKLAASVGLYWQTLVKIRKGLVAKEASEQKILFKEARQDLAKADAGCKYADNALNKALGK